MGSRVNPFPVDTVHGAFVATANAHPDRIAVLGNDDDGTPNLSFRQLVNLCRSLAQHLTRTSSSTHARCGPAIFRAGDPSPGIAVGASAAVSLDSGIELIVAYFAVLMAGKAFAPLETTLPPAALHGVLSALHEHANLTHHIVSATEGTGEPDHPIRPGTRTLAIRLSKSKSADTEPRLEVHERGVPVTVIRCRDTSSDDSDEMEEEMLNTARGGPDDVAHVIHTGGSTGAPKAVVCAHRGSLASHAARAAQHPYTDDDVTGVCVFGVWDAVCALLAGSKVAMLPPESISGGGDVLGRYLCDDKVTRTMLTPSLAELLVAAAAHAESVHAREALDAMRVLVLCGETPRSGLVDALLSSQPDETDEEYSKSRVVANLYSVSEAHDVALERNLGSAVQEGHVSTCGVPHGHVHLAIADDDGCVLAESESEGWLHIAGDGVASGYLGPHGWEATRRAFVSRTWLDGVTRTWYATGDRAKVRKDGRLVLLGRGAGAGRVKIRGKLVDVDGVEEILRGYPGVKACACVARPLSHRENYGDDNPPEALVAFVVPKELVRRRDEADEALSVEDTEAEAINAYLADRLPRWSVPARVVFVASIPLTAALASSAPKCDRRALALMPLPSPRRTRGRRDGEGREVDGTVVAHVAKLAAEVLGVDASSVDGDDSFAQLGGASLEAQRLLYVLRSAAALGTSNYAGGWDRMTPADVIAADTPRRIAKVAMNGSPSDGTGGALTTAGMFAEAAREANEIGVGMWDARGVWKRLEASGSDEVVKRPKPSKTVPSLGRARGVFLTGATGLLGRCLMREILARMAPDAALFCLVRGASAGTAHAGMSARARLEEKADPKTLDSRVRVIAGDATHRKFGLSDEEHARLAASVDVVVHSAGVVSAAAPYASMASGNVAPAREVLRLACLRPGAIVVHHVSSSAVLPPLGTPAASSEESWSESATGGGKALASLAAKGGYDTAEVHGGTWQGYAQAKWVTEMLVWATAESCGVPVCVYRPGNIGPRSDDGLGCEGDGTMALALATVAGGWTSDMRIGERWRLWWTPADAVARAIATVAAIENGDAWANRALHVDPVEPLPASALMNRMKVRMNAGVWKRLEASGSDDDGSEGGGGDGDDDDDVSAWRRAVLAGRHALPPTLRRKVESLLVLKSGLTGAMGAAERRMDGTELRAMLQTEENGDLFMDACEEVLGRYVDAFAEHVRGER